VVTYHRSWSYLTARFDLRSDVQMEPKPGIPPSAKHLADVVDTVQARRAKVVLQEPFYSTKAAEFVASRTGAAVLVAASMTGGSPEAKDYLAMLDDVIVRLGKALAHE
jgi:zinc/manganese transport system substrate-binding protein